MAGERWTICWDEYSADTYLYGSRIIWHRRDHVEFQNLLMPPGTVIKQWYSKTNFQLKRIEPGLPMIDGECNYRLTVNIDTDPGENCLVRLLFYDRYGTEAGSITTRDAVTDFKCPLKTYSYCMQLINGGVSKFHFHFIVIQEVIEETDEWCKET